MATDVSDVGGVITCTAALQGLEDQSLPDALWGYHQHVCQSMQAWLLSVGQPEEVRHLHGVLLS